MGLPGSLSVAVDAAAIKAIWNQNSKLTLMSNRCHHVHSFAHRSGVGFLPCGPVSFHLHVPPPSLLLAVFPPLSRHNGVSKATRCEGNVQTIYMAYESVCILITVMRRNAKSFGRIRLS